MLGCDIIEIERVKDSLERLGERFVNRILAEPEKELFHKRKQSAEFLAGRFAAKEAVAKAFRTGIGETVAFTDIAILPDSLGAPVVFIKGEKADGIEISISHCKAYAMAVCLKR